VLTLTAGQYSGDVVTDVATGGLLLSLTHYREGAPCDDLHRHENPHLSLFLSGGFVVASRRGETEFHPGQARLFESDDLHATHAKRPHGRAVNIEITPAFFAQYELTERDLVSAFANSPGAGLLLFSVYRDMIHADAVSALSVECRVVQWLGPPCPIAADRAPAWVRRLRDHLQAHWHSPQSLASLAAVVGCHPVTLAKNFPRYFGSTLGEYLRRLRAGAAARRIRGSDDSFAAIAHDCGFSDQSHLGRTLRHYTGFAPRQLRRA
jgi:AraC family transcriptional regulator